MSSFINQAWIEQLNSYSELIIGYSGGLDSTVLLYELAEIPVLKSKLCVIHVHHGLSLYADHWQTHCELFCQKLDVPLEIYRISITALNNLEEQARNKRFEIFKAKLSKESCLLLAHHQDDQAETVLLHLARGAGLKGLCGMRESNFGNRVVFKPLLAYSRADLEKYARMHSLQWIEDESNLNIDFSRNYMRHAVLPILKEKWPKIANHIAQCALHLQEAQQNLFDLAYIDCPSLQTSPESLPLSGLTQLPLARLKNIIMVWLYQKHLRLPNTKTIERVIDEVIYSREDGQACVSWDGMEIRRYRQHLYWLKQEPVSSHILWENFPETLILNAKEELIATPNVSGVYIPPHSRVEIRYRRGGERIKIRSLSQSLKKLFQEAGIPPWQRNILPLIYVNDELVEVLDFCRRDAYDQAEDLHIYRIERRQR